MDPTRSASRSNTRGVSPALAGSRLPTKRNSLLSLRRESKETLSHTDPRPAAVPASPSAVSDTSTNGTDSFPGARNGFGFGHASASRRSSSSSQSDGRGRLADGRTTGQTRIPRLSPSQEPRSISTVGLPSPTPRRPISIKDAFRLAQREDARMAEAGGASGDTTMDMTVAEAAAQGSPSPAPRPWRRGGPGGSGSAGGGGYAKGTPTPAPAVTVPSENDNRAGGSGGLFSPRARVSPKIAASGRELHRRASNSNLGEKSKVPVPSPGTGTGTGTAARASLPSWGAMNKPGSALRQAAAKPDFGVKQQQKAQQTPPLQDRSPNKSFAWDADADFTAGDLMASESPPVKTGEGLGIRGALGDDDGDDGDGLRRETPQKQKKQQQNSRTDDALQRLDESEAEGHYGRDPDEILPEAHAGADSNSAALAAASASAVRNQGRRQRGGWAGLARSNKKIDEIQELEKKPLSKAAVSQARLEGIRQQNAEWIDPSAGVASRERLPSQESEGNHGNDNVAGGPHDRSRLDNADGEHIPNTPVTIFRTASRDRGRTGRGGDGEHQTDHASDGLGNNNNNNGASRTTTSSVIPGPLPGAHARSESHELLRKLARVTTSVAAVEQRRDRPVAGATAVLSAQSSRDSLRGGGGGGGGGPEDAFPGFFSDKNLRLPRAREADTLRPTVGFASLRRMPSNESTASTKRSSAVHSDGDPIDRIEAEMKLFAPAENHSERGSIRAPSPDDDGNDRDSESDAAPEQPQQGNPDADEATPRAQKMVADPLMQPTPRVTGAYVETPATVRVETRHDTTAQPPLASGLSVPAMIAVLRGEDASQAAANKDKSSSSSSSSKPNSDDGARKQQRRRPLSGARSRSHSRSRSRSQSASRADAPVFNSAKVATAREDLLALQQTMPVEDPTLETFAELLAAGGSGGPGPDSADKDDEVLPPGEAENPERLRRMSQSIHSTLLDMRQAKKNIERIEDNVSHPGVRGLSARQTDEDKTKEVKVKKEEGEEEAKAAAVQAQQALRMRKKRNVSEVVEMAALVLAEEEKKKDHEATKVPERAAVSVVQIPVPRLYRSEGTGGGRGGTWRLTLLGAFLLAVSLYLAAEGTACALYCRPSTCGSGDACAWSPDDPTFGSALLVKTDAWLTGGHGRVLAARAGEAVGDWAADTWDAATGRDIRQVDPTYFSFEAKRRHRRRLQKRGLVAAWTPPAEVVPRLEAWRREREAREAREARRTSHDGFEEEDDGDELYGGGYRGGRTGESMAADERVGGGGGGGSTGWW